MIGTLLVDAHVHYHECFGVEPFLDAALVNFQAARRALGTPDAIGCLMLTESSWCHYFHAFADGMVDRSSERWTVEATSERCSIVTRRGMDAPIVLIAGRQIVTSDRLEVLALATVEEYPDGVPIGQAVECALSTGALTVLPWGFGKWTGKRGRVVKDILSSSLAERVYVGDNGGRPGAAPEPALFRMARDRGVPILPGSDPLPLRPEVHKPGRVGLVLEGSFDLDAPADGIREALSSRSQPRRFGRLEGLLPFVHRQVALRLSGRRRTRAPDAAAPEGGSRD